MGKKKQERRFQSWGVLVVMPRSVKISMYVVELKLETKSLETIVVFTIVIARDQALWQCGANTSHSDYNQEVAKSLWKVRLVRVMKWELGLKLGKDVMKREKSWTCDEWSICQEDINARGEVLGGNGC